MKKILLCLTFLIIFTGCNKNNNNNNGITPNVTPVPIVPEDATLKTNTRENIIKNQVVDGIDFEYPIVKIENGKTNIIISVTNNNDQDYNLGGYIIIARDEHDEEITRIDCYVGSVIKAGETKIINASSEVNLDTAYSFEYEVKK